MKYRYSVMYRRLMPGRRIYRMTVTASDADEARRMVAIRDPQFGSTITSPKRGAVLVEPEQADGMTAAKAREDLERGTAHFDREYVEWRGTEVEVVD